MEEQYQPERVTLGMGFYGRSFTMKSSSCMAAGCPFESGGKEGRCTGTEGVLSVGEINQAVKKGAKVTFDQVAGVKIATWDGNRQYPRRASSPSPSPHPFLPPP